MKSMVRGYGIHSERWKMKTSYNQDTFLDGTGKFRDTILFNINCKQSRKIENFRMFMEV